MHNKTAQNAVELTRQLIKIPSESSNTVSGIDPSPELAVAKLLEQICASNNVTYQYQEALPNRYNFIARFPQADVPKLLIAAHMDTVSSQDMKAPFSARLKDGKIFGRGACDDKGPLACAFSTLIDLHKEGRQLCYDVTILASIDEECSMAGAAMFAKESLDYDVCMAMEPTSLRLINSHKGVYRCQITCQGKGAHSSSPELGENAILKMHAIIEDLKILDDDLNVEKFPNLGPATIAITQINGGTVVNIIPDKCTMSMDIRLLPNHEPKAVEKKIKKIVGDRGKVRKFFAAKALYTPLECDHVSSFLTALANEGFASEPTTASYATDCSRLSNKGPCFVWGPGSIKQAHQNDEYIEVEQIEKACHILAKFLSA